MAEMRHLNYCFPTTWKIQPLVNYLGGEFRVFMLSRDNLSNSLTKCMEPQVGGMSYFCKTYKNINGTATIETNSMYASTVLWTVSWIHVTTVSWIYVR